MDNRRHRKASALQENLNIRAGHSGIKKGRLYDSQEIFIAARKHSIGHTARFSQQLIFIEAY
jgi:hypothetical protein